MSMEFGDDNEIRGGGSALMGLLAGSALNKDRDDGRSMTWFAMVIVLIVFFIAIIFLALAFKDRGHDRKDYGGTDIAAMLTPLIAAKSMDCNNGKNDYDHDHLEIKQMIEHTEDRREISGIKSELGAVALMIQKTASDNEKDNLKEFGEIKQQLGVQSQALQQILTIHNNEAITRATINGVIMQLTGRPCIG